MPFRAAQLEAPATFGLGLSTHLRFAVLGDSIAYGQGASDPKHTVGARLAAELGRAGIVTDLAVLAVPRARSDALPEQVQRARSWSAQLALIIIGANDLTHFVPTGQAAASLRDAVRSLRAAAISVVVAPAPDLSVVPWVPQQFRALVSNGSALLRRAQTDVARAEGAVIADLDETASAFAADETLFGADRFHPSSAGYALIAAALLPAILESAARITVPAGSGEAV